ncbi:uridine kinase [Kribbella albertanoniae]|uniref:Uridine kinase n=1 Tax=Kribbella albertanoniae TaxID=1266829 RepID=A0A4R4Q2N6_9ACTN|nr:uridine kinase [Kribbella albertanoniae]TDC29109.1 uridine kinase [Kribbella albertanoniae]
MAPLKLLSELAGFVLAVERPHPVRVAIDGPSAAGKTTLADELADVLRERTAREVIRVGLDYFKKDPALRTAYPIESPESYYLDSWDVDGIRSHLLLPLGPDGDRRYVAGMRSFNAQSALAPITETAAADAVLVADGVFLQRPELIQHWDLRVYVHVGFDVVLRRGTVRDQAWMDSAAAAEERYRRRYIPGERLYVDQVEPASLADLVVDNTDFANPVLRQGKS